MVVPSVMVPSVVVVITDVLHSGPVNPWAHSTPSLTLTNTLSMISIKPIGPSVPSGNSVSIGDSLTKPSSTPFLVALINIPILGLADEYSGLRLSAHSVSEVAHQHYYQMGESTDQEDNNHGHHLHWFSPESTP